MKKLAYYFSAVLLSAAVLFTSCKKDSEPTPDPAPEAKVFTSKMTVDNFGTSGDANVIGRVTTADGIAKIRLSVSGNNNLDQIFVMLSQDNGPLEALRFSTITNELGQTFQGGSNSYSLKIPNLKNFTVDLPVPVRTSSAAVTDVYQIWITNGDGAFNKPTKNRDLGIATVVLKYTAAAPSETFATATLDLGSQSSLDYASLLVTTGQVSALNTADYVDAPASADIRFVTLTATKKDNNSSSLFLYSPADVADANPPVVGSPQQVAFDTAPLANSRSTTFSTYSGGTAFADVTAADISAVTVGSATNIQVSAGNVYAFETESGKKGLIKINSTGSTSNYTGVGTTTAQNMNVTIKVLN